MFARGASTRKVNSAPSQRLRDLADKISPTVPPSQAQAALKKVYHILLHEELGDAAARDLYDAGLLHGCASVLTRQPLAAIILNYVDVSGDYLNTIFYLRGFQDAIVPLLREENESMLNMMWNMSDKEALAMPLCSVPGLLSALLDGCGARPHSGTLVCSLSSLRNLTMFPKSRDELLAQLDRTAMLQVLGDRSKSTDTTVSTKAMMAIANLVGRDEQDESSGLMATTPEMLLRIVVILKRALRAAGVEHGNSNQDNEKEAEEEEDWYDQLGTFKLYEPLLSLRNLSVSSSNRAALLPLLRDVLPSTLQQAQKEEVCRGEAVGYTLAICSQFAFDADCLRWFQQHTDLELQVKQILAKVHAGEDAEEYDSALQREAEGLLWTLQGEKTAASSSSPPQHQQQQQQHVMISYSWKQKDVALKIAAFLRHHGLLVWQDVDDMQHNIMESMAQAVTGAFAVVILMSKNYKESANCQREASYAAKKHKKIVPLNVVQGYQADGWLELIIAHVLPYDLTGQNFDSMLSRVVSNELVGGVGGSGATRAASFTATTTMTPSATATEVFERVCANFPELSYLQLAFEREELDSVAVRRLVRAWQAGHIRVDEIKLALGVKSLGHLLKLKDALEELAAGAGAGAS